MSSQAPRLFRQALLVEAVLNIGSIPFLVLMPKRCLSYLMVKDPDQATPAATSLLQWLGAIIVLATVPLVLAYPEPTSSEPPSLVTARRRMAYASLGASEVAIGATLMGQFFTGNSGMSDTALLSGAATMAVLVLWRVYCLYVKPEIMQAAIAAGRSR